MKRDSSLKWNHLGIALKTSIISGLVVLLLLASTAWVILGREAGLISSVIDSYAQKVNKTFESKADQERAALRQRHQINAKICSGLSSYFVYNFEPDGLKEHLQPFLYLPDILAIGVRDSSGKPFAALWKTNDHISSAESFPDDLAIDDKLSFYENIFYENESLGEVVIYYTDRLVAEQLKHSQTASKQEISVFRATVDKKLDAEIAIQATAFGIVVVALVFTLMLTLRIVVISPIKGISAGLKDIAKGEGDLTKRLVINSKDEVGDLGFWFNTFITKIHEIIKDVSSSAGRLDNSSKNLTQISDLMTQSADQTSSKATTVSRNSEAMSNNMNSVATAMEEAAGNINMVASAAEEMTTTINEIAQNTEKARGVTNSAVNQAKGASKQVGKLGEAATEIGKVIETITEISEQVNLLALNATIEAARAGDAGKGFAVVANEIKDLAKQTAEATGEIKSRVEDIQTSTNGTVDQIESITKVVNDVNDIVSTIATALEEQSLTTQEIAGNVNQASHGIGEVNANVGYSSAATAEIAKEISEVTIAANEISSNSSQVSINAKDLKQLANQLMEMVGRFKL